MSDPIRQAIPTPERLQAMAAGFGRFGQAAQRAVGTMVELLAPIARRELAKAYGSQPPMWRPLTRRTDPTIGRKRRARRARGRRIEARRIRELRQPRLSLNGRWVPVGFVEGVTVLPESITIRWKPANEQVRAKIAAETERWTNAEWSLGKPWEEQADG